jgi:single-strand DNA-binding protein
MNNITVTGNVGRDPELKYSNNGMAILKFSVADTRNKGDEKVTQWWNIVCFKELAENVAASIGKGTRVQVIGKVQREKYEDKEGAERERIEILADDVGISLRWEPAGESAPVRGGDTSGNRPLPEPLDWNTMFADKSEEPF